MQKRLAHVAAQVIRCAVVFILLPACSAQVKPGSARIEGESVDTVLLRVKQDLGAYQHITQSYRAHPEYDPARAIITGAVCDPHHPADFDLTILKLELKAVVDEIDQVNASLKVPFGLPAAGASISPGYKGSSESKATNTLDLYLYPENTPYTPPPTAVLENSVPITLMLLQLRNSLIKSAQSKPCVALSHDNKDKEDTFSVAL